MNPFEGLSRKKVKITVGGKQIEVRPLVKDVELFMTLGTEGKKMTLDESKQTTSIMKDIIKRANQDASDEDIEAFITMNYGEMLMEMTIVFGIATREDIKRIKQMRADTVKKNIPSQ